MDEKYAEKRLVHFNKECILAGPRTSVIGFLRLLRELGAEETKAPGVLLSSKTNVVLLLKNEGTNRKFPKVMLLSRSWWDYYHNPKKNKSNLKTYNIARQWDKVCKEILLTEDIPTLIPETV